LAHTSKAKRHTLVGVGVARERERRKGMRRGRR